MAVMRRREKLIHGSVPEGKSSTEPTREDLLACRFKKLEAIKKKRLEIQKINIEDARKDMMNSAAPRIMGGRAQRHREKAEMLIEKKNIEDQGKDYERVRSMGYTAEEVELWNERREEKVSNADEGFTDYIQIHAKKHRKQVAKLRPNLSAYRELKEIEKAADSQGRSLVFSLLSSKPTPEAIENVILDLKDQDERRNNFPRRRTFDENDDVTYINERNMRFNNKMARAYDKYTSEIRANFERGTAI